MAFIFAGVQVFVDVVLEQVLKLGREAIKPASCCEELAQNCLFFVGTPSSRYGVFGCGGLGCHGVVGLK